MLSFLNMQTKAQFLAENVEAGRNITKSATNIREWVITDSTGSSWGVVCVGTSQFYIHKRDSVKDKTPAYLVQVTIAGQNVKIISCSTEGKNYKAEKYLKKYKDIAGVVGNYLYHGYLKV